MNGEPVPHILCKALTWPKPITQPWPCDKRAKFAVITHNNGSTRYLCGRHITRWRQYEGVAGPLRVTITPLVPK